MLIEDGVVDPSNVTECAGVKGGYDNHCAFLMRLIDRGWVSLTLTDAGKEALHGDE
jgi:hypothetical protein